MQDQIIDQIKIEDMDGQSNLVSFLSLESSIQKREFEPKFEKELDANAKNDELMELIRRYMFVNQVPWKDLIKKFSATRRGEITLDSFIDTLFELGIVESGTGLEAVFKRYDRDGSGTLNSNEFLGAFESQYNKRKVYRPKQQNFEFYDKVRELLRK